jgi:hypothetical protein
MICTLNLQILHDWKNTTGTTEPIPTTENDELPNSTVPASPAETGRPPPDR